MTEKKKLLKKRITAITVIVIILAVSVFLTIVMGKRIVAFATNSEKVRSFVDAHYFESRLLFILVTVIQIILAFIPGEAVELAAGYAFGPVEGSILCLIGAMIGGTLVFLIVRKFGIKAVRLFFSKEKTDKLKFLKASPKRDFWMFMLMFIPGTPKDLFSYFAGLTDIPVLKWIILSTVARIPSIVTSSIGASYMGENKVITAVIVFGITLVISLAGLFIYNKICDKRSKNQQGSEDDGLRENRDSEVAEKDSGT